jgi:soluble lytic murein transglycosylase-like protein
MASRAMSQGSRPAGGQATRSGTTSRQNSGPGKPAAAKRPTTSQYSTKKERTTANPKRTAKPKPIAKKPASTRRKSVSKNVKTTPRKRRNPLPRVAKQSGGWALVVPLPTIRIKTIRKNAKRVRKLTSAGLRSVSHLPRVGMRAVSATFFLGAIAYALLPSARELMRDVPGPLGDVFRAGLIASTFTPEVQRWSGKIAAWSEEYGLEANLMATVMQIESCGHPTVSSPSGAQGLFQVMPFHFASNEAMTDPETNAMRGAGVMQECLRRSNGNIRDALACYNGGPSQIGKPTDQWPSETQRYVVWGLGIYTDAQSNADSATLDAWLNAGGSGLCNAARNVSIN